MRVLLLVRGRTRCTEPHLELRFVTSLDAQDGRPSRPRECGGLTEMTDTASSVAVWRFIGKSGPL